MKNVAKLLLLHHGVSMSTKTNKNNFPRQTLVRNGREFLFKEFRGIDER